MQLERMDPGRVRLGHLLAADRQEPVCPDLGGRLDAGRHQHRGPVDRVLPEDVLADHVDVRRPAPREGHLVRAVAGGREVVREGIEPDVGDVVGVPRQRDPPVEVRPADREVPEPAPDQGQHLVPPDVGLHGGRRSLVVLQEAVSIGREPEEVVLLLHHLDRTLVDRAQLALQEVPLHVVELAGHAVQALVRVEVDVVPTVVVHLVK